MKHVATVKHVAAVSLVVLLVALVPGCNRDARDSLVLDGRPRVPDDEGIATSVTAKRIVLDGRRAYSFSSELASFSTYTMKVAAVRSYRGQYVHVGLNGTKAEWVAGIGAVLPGPPDEVVYRGVFERVKAGRAEFRDGTALRTGAGLTPPPAGPVHVVLDPRQHEIRSMAPTAAS